jgi:putative transposase
LELTRRKQLTLKRLLSVYRNILGECVNYAWKNGITSRGRLHRELYPRLRKEYPNLPSHYIYTAITRALGIIKSFKRRRKIKLAKKDAPEVSNISSILLDDYHLFKVCGKSLRLNTEEGHIYLPLKPTKYQLQFLPSIRQGVMLVKRGNRWFLHATIKREVEYYKPNGYLAYDINEKSLDMLMVKPDKIEYIHIDISEVKHIQKRYQEIKERKKRYDKGRAKRRVDHLYMKHLNF